MSTGWTPALWIDTFHEIIEEELEYDDWWSFHFAYRQQNDLSERERRMGWKIYCPSARGNFRCGACSKTWPSARISLLFRYRLLSEEARGTVLMRPFGQECRRCVGAFERPGFSREEIKKVLLNLIGKIKKNCYGEHEEGSRDFLSSEKVRTKPHESSLCEACHQGMCCAEDRES
ncbi:hypothetical protein GJAV_G00099320 [Gymnothorax javanicus]|nr:hypothetical protein GJAV_G00099320 [Gymnothorax javanicus]